MLQVAKRKTAKPKGPLKKFMKKYFAISEFDSNFDQLVKLNKVNPDG
ncbi:MAG: hypothetical protein MZV63_25115 [Marinilabiliales bacterium]|nr:hypothetical protein [Marinilabiliales bacterium]